MHRAYQPIEPATNKLLIKRWDEKRFDRHRQKVQSAMPVIDDKPPNTYLHLHLKLKKMQMEEERLAIIERDNRILLEKMCIIMLTRGSVDNNNFYDSKSLNRMARQRELLRITHENQAIMRRILSKQPTYHNHLWDHDWELNKMYMKNIAKYPQLYESAYDHWNRINSTRRAQQGETSDSKIPSVPVAEKERQAKDEQSRDGGQASQKKRVKKKQPSKPNGCGVS